MPVPLGSSWRIWVIVVPRCTGLTDLYHMLQVTILPNDLETGSKPRKRKRPSANNKALVQKNIRTYGLSLRLLQICEDNNETLKIQT